MVELQLDVGVHRYISLDVLRHPPSSHVNFELLEPVLQQYFPVLKLMQGSSLGEWLKSPHVELRRFPKDWTPLWTDVVHDNP